MLLRMLRYEGVGDEEKSAYNGAGANPNKRQPTGRAGFQEVGRRRTGTVSERYVEMQTEVSEKP